MKADGGARIQATYQVQVKVIHSPGNKEHWAVGRGPVGSLSGADQDDSPGSWVARIRWSDVFQQICGLVLRIPGLSVPALCTGVNAATDLQSFIGATEKRRDRGAGAAVSRGIASLESMRLGGG